MTPQELDTCLKSLLQRNVSFNINNKTIREGLLVLFHVKDFYISFILKTEKYPSKTYEIPVPYSIKQQQDHYLFDYSNKHIHKGDQKLSLLIAAIHKEVGKKSKFLDNTLTIKMKNLD